MWRTFRLVRSEFPLGGRQGINPKQYLTDVLTRLPGMLAKDAHTLTPPNWLKSRNGKPERMVA